MDISRKIIYRSLIFEGLVMLKNIPVPIQSIRTGVYRDVADIFALLAKQSISDFENFDESAEQLIILQIQDVMTRYHYYNVGKIPEYLQQLA
jgi:hypothetical protein